MFKLENRKDLNELTVLYEQIKDQIAKTDTLIAQGTDLGFAFNFMPPGMEYEQAIRTILHLKPPKTAMKKGELGDDELNEIAAIQQSLDLEKQEQDI
ncbi:MAG: hypothetical protein EZS28_055539 [Streblomastix strix]|uniref:Uncharacterized protein n=1 Tax=Streblomastix strix TaxID=222440 RepID=A0A5J4Q0T0_9EUKA|nr:MAG: hypothetical protein EZS28_055539 [Streblomastix strix]